jgi:hypothetical protein
VWTTKDRAVAVGHSVGPDGWQQMFDELTGRLARRFKRMEPRRRVRGLLAELPGKTSDGRKSQATAFDGVGKAVPSW